MKVTQFGNFYFDPAKVIAINTEPLRAHRGGERGTSRYFVYIKDISNPILLTGEAAEECLATFSGKAKEEQKENSKKEDKNDKKVLH